MNSKIIYFLAGLLFVSISLNIYLYQFSLTTLARQQPSIANVDNSKLASPTTNVRSYEQESANASSSKQVNKGADYHPPLDDNLNLLVATAEQLFLAHQFIDAVDYYEQIMVIDSKIAEQLNEQWLNAGYQWVERKKANLLNDFLEVYLTRFPYDEEWLKVKIQWYLSINKAKEVMLIYIDMADNAIDYKTKEIWLDHARQLFDKYSNGLKNKQAWQSIVELSTLMISLDHPYPPYYLAIAEAYIKLDEPATASSYLANVDYVIPYQHRIDALYQMMESQSYQNEGIELVKQDKHFMVSAIINHQHNANLMIDTGASLTVISSHLYEQIFDNVNFKHGREMQINTAGGTQIAFSIIVDEFTLGGQTINDFEIVVLELPNFDKADGLLGMNFLQHFKFEIDQQNSLLFLSTP